MNETVRISDDDRADLVAYLDGELDDARARNLENKLASSSSIRRELDELSLTWAMLSELEPVQASEVFTNRTMLSIVAECTSENDAIEWRGMSKRIVVACVSALGLFLAAALGFWLTDRQLPPESRLLLEEYPLIRNLHLYQEVDDVEFVRELHDRGLFNESR